MITSASAEPLPCPKCNDFHQRPGGKPTCAGHTGRVTGPMRPCQTWPMTGQTVCSSHGGKAPQNVAAAKRRIEAAALEKAVVTYGARREIGHLQAMVELLHDSAGHVAWLRDMIQAQAPGALVWGRTDELTKGGEFPTVDTRHAAAASVWLELYHRERRVLLDVSKELAKLELDWDAREAIRRQGAALAVVVRETVRRLGHDPNDRKVVEAFRASLRGVGAGPDVDVDRVIEGRPE